MASGSRCQPAIRASAPGRAPLHPPARRAKSVAVAVSEPISSDTATSRAWSLRPRSPYLSSRTGTNPGGRLSSAALEALAIVAYRQPIGRSGIEHIRGSASDSAIATLLERGLIAHNPHHLFVTTRAFLDFVASRDLADLPSR